MKIRGNVVGTPMKRPDFEQKDPKKSDFIKNNPIPDITEEDEGKIPKVVNGKYVLTDDINDLQAKEMGWLLNDKFDNVEWTRDFYFVSNGTLFNQIRLKYTYTTVVDTIFYYALIYRKIDGSEIEVYSSYNSYGWTRPKYQSIIFVDPNITPNDITLDHIATPTTQKETLETTSKSIVGAINDLQAMVNGYTWIFNETLDGVEWTRDFRFMSDGMEFNQIRFVHTYMTVVDTIYYDALIYRKVDNSEIEAYRKINGVSEWTHPEYQYISAYNDISLSDVATKIAIPIGQLIPTKSKSVVGAINELYGSNLMLVGYVDENGKLWEDAEHQQPLLINFNQNYTAVQADMSLVKIVVDLHTQEIIFGAFDFIINEQLKGTELGEWLELIKKTGVKASQDMNEAIANSRLYQIVMDFLGGCQNLLESVGNWFVTTQVYKDVTEFVNNTGGAIKDSLTNYVNESEIDELSDEEETTPRTRSVKATKSEKTIVGAIQKANRRIAEIEKTVGEGIDTSNLQPKTDATLKTTSKTISGAINELQSALLGEETINLTDLGNTTWLLNETLSIPYGAFGYNIDLISNDTVYSGIGLGASDMPNMNNFATVTYGTQPVYSNINGWTSQANRIVTFTGGADTTNTDLIDWLFRNGDLQRKGYLAHLQAKEDQGLNTENKEIVGAINELNEKVGAGVDTSNLATVDKITYLDDRSGGVSDIEVNEVGVCWHTDEVEIELNDGDDYCYARGGNKIPLVAGENINFEVDEENQVVKINANTEGIVQAVIDALPKYDGEVMEIYDGEVIEI